jgi:hypothetical protein
MKGKKLTQRQINAKVQGDKLYRAMIVRELIKHLEKGMSIESFEFLSRGTINELMKKYPDEFDEADLEHARRLGRDSWERIGLRQALGDCLGNSRTWFYNMANRYGWRDKIDVESEHKGQVQVNVVSYAKGKQVTD